MDPEILTRLEALENRLERLERLAGLAGPSRPAPAVAPPPPPPPSPLTVPGPPPVVVRKAPASPADKPDWEYLIGAKIGPALGAAAMIAAIAFLVSLGLSRGWITPAMLFGGVCLLCLAFIGVGIWKQGEKEEFGKILTGIGSCGLYLNFAAGHLIQHLYAGETLVALFTGLSLVNLGYAFWQSSRAFWIIGMVGGFLAAAMPVDQGKIGLSVALQGLILLPCALILARYRWATMALLLYGAANAVLATATSNAQIGDRPILVGAIYLTATVVLGAFVQCEKDLLWDPQRTLVPLGAALSALFAFALIEGTRGSLHLLAFSGGLLLIAYLLRTKPQSGPLAIGAGIVALALAPFGLAVVPSAFAFALLSALCAAVSIRFYAKAFASFAVVELAIGLAVYVLALSESRLGAGMEATLLSASIGAGLATGYAVYRAWRGGEAVVLATAVLLLPPTVRLVQLGVLAPAVGGGDEYGFTLGLLLYGGVSLALASVLRTRNAFVLFSVVTLTGLAGLAYIAADSSASAAAESLLLFLYLALIGAAARLGGQSVGNGGKQVTWALGAVVASSLVSRLGYLGLTALGLPVAAASTLVMPVLAVAMGVVSLQTKQKALTAAVTSVWIGAIGLYFAAAGAGGSFGGWEPVVLVLLVAASAVSEPSLGADSGPAAPWTVLGAIWIFTSRLGTLWLGPTALGMNPDAAMTTAWILTGLGYLAAGIVRERQLFRFASFVVLGATAFKIVLVDLAQTDQAIKVLILMLLGFVSLGGGYWYVRRYRAPSPKT